MRGEFLAYFRPEVTQLQATEQAAEVIATAKRAPLERLELDWAGAELENGLRVVSVTAEWVV